MVVGAAGVPVGASAGRAQLAAGVRPRLGAIVYGVGDTETLVEKVSRRLIERGVTISVAESCTGGLLGELLTRTPGSSKAFGGGVIAYANEVKVRDLGVAEATLAAHGAVSEHTVREMAAGARQRFGSDLAIGISGVAGPAGGTPDKPVGTVWLALAAADGTTTKKLSWPGLRDQVRLLSSWWGLKLVDELLDRRPA
jgi:nicotinamide-nucleotide amidase